MITPATHDIVRAASKKTTMDSTVKRQLESETKMAGKFRIKVVLDNADPFWMFVRTDDTPQICDIAQTIEQRFKNVKVANLLLDSCVLPPTETSELLRDGDVVHVKLITELDSPVISFDQPTKKNRKRKHAESHGQSHAGSDNQVESIPEIEIRESSGIKSKKKKKHDKHKNTQVTESEVVHQEENGDVQPDKQKEVISQREEVPEDIVVTLECNDQTSSKKKKRRRSRKKKTGTSSTCQSDSENGREKHTAVAQVKTTSAELKLPKWQQSKNKKIVFSSGDEEGTVSDQEESSKRKDGKSQISDQASIADISCSFSEPLPMTSSPNINHEQRMVVNGFGGDAVNSTYSAENGNTSAGLEVSTLADENDVATENDFSKTNGNEDADNWYRDKQYEGRLQEEKKLTRKCASALEKAVTPVHLYTGGKHQVVQPNLAEYLKMMPDDRGVKLPPYMKAQRLSNGAVLYSRTRIVPSKETKNLSASGSAKSCPPELSKERQISSVNTNKSIIIQNTFNSSSGKNGTDVNGITTPTEETGHTESSVIPTSISREYSSFPDLTAAPKPGDRIAYKILEMGENYTPGISDYKEAEVLGYDAASQSVTVRLIQAGTKKTPGKFDLPDQEATEEEAITVELSAMFEPKLMTS